MPMGDLLGDAAEAAEDGADEAFRVIKSLVAFLLPFLKKGYNFHPLSNPQHPLFGIISKDDFIQGSV